MLVRVLGTALAALVAVGVAAPPAGADGNGPRLGTSSWQPSRGDAQTLYGGYFAPDATFDVSIDDGTVGDGGTNSTQVSTNDNGDFSVGYTVGSDIPPDVTTVNFTATDPDSGDVLASLSLPLAPPGVSGTVVCPARANTVYGYGFPDGTYTLSSPYLGFAGQVSVTGGTFSAYYTVGDAPPETFTVTATEQSSGYVYSFPWRRKHTTLGLQHIRKSPWKISLRAGCLSPGATLTHGQLPAGVSLPDRIVANDAGVARFDETLVAGARRSQVPRLQLQPSSGRDVQTPAQVLPATTLRPGQSLSGPRPDQPDSQFYLLGPHPGTAVYANQCNPVLEHYYVGGGQSDSSLTPGQYPWSPDCSLTLSRSGDLRLTGPHGRLLWHSGTRGTTMENRFVVGQGTAVIRTATDAAIWSAERGALAAPHRAVLRTGRSRGRGSPLRRGDVTFGLTGRGALVVRRAGKVVHTVHVDRRAAHLTVDRAGRLMLTSQSGVVLWHAVTGGRPAAEVVVEPTGDVCLLNARGQRIWHTGTAV